VECLILDVLMPRISGLDLQQRLAEIACRIPIIFVTAYTDENVRKKALDHGVRRRSMTAPAIRGLCARSEVKMIERVRSCKM
jgi:CheY-like chemotaxis protein